jgi:hypothetical protein
MIKGRYSLLAALPAAVLVAGVLGACGDDTLVNAVTRVDTVRVTRTDTVIRRDTVRFNEFRIFNQVERLGNPLVAEVLLEKRDHDFHDAGTPSTDRANFRAKVIAFITGTARRSVATASAIADALLPDMLTVQTDRAANTAGYLSYVLNPNAYGGRPLRDDVVDISLLAVFGPLLDPNNVSPGLVSDNVPAFGGGPAPTTTFPYLAAPNQ